MRKFWEILNLFAFGAVAYCFIEVLWRGNTHWTMGILGGALFVAIGLLDKVLPFELGLLTQGLVGGALITAAEFVAGCVLNLWLGLHIWDYSDMPFNLLGQICLTYSVYWVIISIVAVMADDFIRWRAWGEEHPHYKLL